MQWGLTVSEPAGPKVTFPARTEMQTIQTAAALGIPGLIKLSSGVRTIKASDIARALGMRDLSNLYSQLSIRAWLIRKQLGRDWATV